MLTQFLLWIKSVGLSEEAQGLVEYALIIALIAIVLVGALVALEGGINGVFGEIIAAFPLVEPVP
jgi:pilus assembly protein Flp/PilA